MYNEKPIDLGVHEVATVDLEMMCYLYYPIKVPGQGINDFIDYLEPRQCPFIDLIHGAMAFEAKKGNDIINQYAFLTIKHLFVTPGNCANRPGWHADGFGGNDINYTWCNRYPTLFSRSQFENIPNDHIRSLEAFDSQAKPEKTLTRITPFVVHHIPKIVETGMRTFWKLSIADKPYNLKGNSKNPRLADKTQWKEHWRTHVRNDPAFQG
jgi:hypothetical protein